MWIMTQGKKGIVNSDETASIVVTQNIGKKKGAIVSYPNNIILGYYDTKKIAFDELENLLNALKSDEKTYQMP